MVLSVGQVVRLTGVGADHHAVELGDVGVVQHVDWCPTVRCHVVRVLWRSGSQMRLVMPPDQVEVLAQDSRQLVAHAQDVLR